MSNKHKDSVFFKARGKKTRFFNQFVYDIVRFYLHWFLMLMFGSRVHSYGKLLRHQSYILICNHQSYLDPVMFPAMSNGTYSFAARHTLFRNKIFAKLITFLGAFPIVRGASNSEAFNLMSDELAGGSSLIIFAEGTRSLDGKIKKFKGGMEIILRKTKAPVQIAVISGNHKILPKGRKLTNFAAYPMNTMFAAPITADEYLNMPTRKIAEFLETKTRQTFADLQSKPYLKMRGITAISQIAVEIFNLYTTCIFSILKFFKRNKT